MTDIYSLRRDGYERSIFKLLVDPHGLSITFQSSDLLEESPPVGLPLNTWSFVAVQVRPFGLQACEEL